MQGTGEKEMVLSGGFGRPQNSARYGFLPVPLRYVPARALDGICVYVRRRRATDSATSGSLSVQSDADTEFTDTDRDALMARGVRFVYIRIADQTRFRHQVEECVSGVAQDPTLAISDKSAIIYETSVELINELLSEPDLGAQSMRLENVSRAITTLVLSEPGVFSHLFAASHHDFYTATHMVNVATWIVPLAHMMGYRSPDELTRICQAGLLHDIGKVFVPEEILNKRGNLTDADWNVIRQHPTLGVAHLESFEGVSELAKIVTREHHERLDGTGYPLGMSGDEIHPISRMCAVVDSFDAMTALRPFKGRTLTVVDAVEILRSEAGVKYDREAVETWLTLIGTTGDPTLAAVPGATGVQASVDNRRRRPRVACHCTARLHILHPAEGGGLHESPGFQAVVHSASRSGLGVLCPTQIELDTTVRVYLLEGALSGRILHGRTVRCRDYRDGWCEVGLELLVDEEEEESFEDLQARAAELTSM
jgi:putative nucleotidyltransferase with HDIG domain